MPYWLRYFQIAAVLLSLSACGFDADELREYLPPEIANAPGLYAERGILFCAVAIYQLPKDTALDDIPLSKPDLSTSDWRSLPFEGKVEVGSFAAQALFDGDGCFDHEAKRITGLSRLSEYYSSERTGFFIELGHDLVLVHDTGLNVVIISSRAR